MPTVQHFQQPRKAAPPNIIGPALSAAGATLQRGAAYQQQQAADEQRNAAYQQKVDQEAVDQMVRLAYETDPAAAEQLGRLRYGDEVYDSQYAALVDLGRIKYQQTRFDENIKEGRTYIRDWAHNIRAQADRAAPNSQILQSLRGQAPAIRFKVAAEVGRGELPDMLQAYREIDDELIKLGIIKPEAVQDDDALTHDIKTRMKAGGFPLDRIETPKPSLSSSLMTTPPATVTATPDAVKAYRESLARIAGALSPDDVDPFQYDITGMNEEQIQILTKTLNQKRKQMGLPPAQ